MAAPSPLVGSPPPGLLEGFIQLPADGAGKQLRAFPITVYEQQVDGTFASATAYQQVFVLADADGNQLGVQGAPLTVQSRGLETRLDRVESLLQQILDVLSENS